MDKELQNLWNKYMVAYFKAGYSYTEAQYATTRDMLEVMTAVEPKVEEDPQEGDNGSWQDQAPEDFLGE